MSTEGYGFDQHEQSVPRLYLQHEAASRCWVLIAAEERISSVTCICPLGLSHAPVVIERSQTQQLQHAPACPRGAKGSKYTCIYAYAHIHTYIHTYIYVRIYVYRYAHVVIHVYIQIGVLGSRLRDKMNHNIGGVYHILLQSQCVLSGPPALYEDNLIVQRRIING